MIVDEPLDSDLEQDEENVIVDEPRENDLEQDDHDHCHEVNHHLVQDHCQEVHQQSHLPRLHFSK